MTDHDDEQRPRQRVLRYLRSLTKEISLILLGVIVSSIALSFGDPAHAKAVVVWRVENWTWRGVPTSCSDPAWLTAVTPQNAEAEVEKPNKNGITYYANNSDDGQITTAWAQPYPSANGNSITWTLPVSVPVRLMCLTTGYAKSAHAYQTNERLRAVTLSFPGTSCPDVNRQFPDLLAPRAGAPPTDYAQLASVPVSCRTKQVKLTIDATYPASDGSTDVAISEVRFYRS